MVLDEAYIQNLKRIDQQSSMDSSLARRAISWISYAQRPLTTRELCCAVSIELGMVNMPNIYLYSFEDVGFACSGLIMVDGRPTLSVSCTTRHKITWSAYDQNGTLTLGERLQQHA